MTEDNNNDSQVTNDIENAQPAADFDLGFLASTDVFDGDLERDTTPLDDVEIEEAEAKIAQLHPLRKLRLWQVFPSLRIFIRCCCKENEERIRKEREFLIGEYKVQNTYMDKLINQYDKKPFEGGSFDELVDAEHSDSVSEESFRFAKIHKGIAEFFKSSQDDDPFCQLGFGYVAYLNMLVKFMGLFCFFTVLMIPTIGIYFYQGALSGQRNYSSTEFSLGNLGFSEAKCVSQYATLNLSPRTIGCTTGLMYSVYSYGIVPSDNTISDYCGLPADDYYGGVQKCVGNVNGDDLVSYFNDNCFKQKNCKIDITNYIYFSANSTTNTEWSDNSPEICQNQDSRMYMQYYCVQEGDIVEKKRVIGLYIACTGIFICWLYYLMILYLNKVGSLDYKLWDIQTVTAADFTVEQVISKKFWKTFKEQIRNPDSTHGASTDFEVYLKGKFEELVSAQPPVTDASQTECKVANITFSYNNRELIQLLMKRGSLVAQGRFDKLQEVDKEIDDLKNLDNEEFYRPVGAFITFETQEGMFRAKALKGHIDWRGKLTSDHKLLNQPIYLRPASEPTNIIWENRQISYRKQFCRGVYAVTCIIILLTACFLFFSFLKIKSVQQSVKYPISTNCTQISELFTENGEVDEQAYHDYAVIDFESTMKGQGTGIYQCYCKGTGLTYFSIWSPKEDCYQYSQDIGISWLYFQIVSYSIVIINIILRYVNIFFIKKVGFHRLSQEIKYTMTAIFVSTFTNTAILILLTNANTLQSYFNWVRLDGRYADLIDSWYVEIGPSLISTMLVNSVYCWIDFFIYFTPKCLLRVRDRRICCYCRKKTTRQLTIQQYVNLYSGTEHAMHFKYSMIMVVTFVTFMYGLALPLLFPLAVFTFANQYICEKLMLAYWYKMPPAYDDTLNNAALKILKWPPVFMCFFGYWILGNMQIFSNLVKPLERSNSVLQTGHTGKPYLNQALPLLIMGIFFFFASLCFQYTRTCCRKFKIMEEEDLVEDVDEKLGTYYNCVSARDRKRWYCEEVYNQEKLGVKTLCDSVLEKLRTANTGDSALKNAYNYEILSNPKYIAAFQYVPIEIRDTEEEMRVADIVTKILFLGNTDGTKKIFCFNTVKGKLSLEKTMQEALMQKMQINQAVETIISFGNQAKEQAQKAVQMLDPTAEKDEDSEQEQDTEITEEEKINN